MSNNTKEDGSYEKPTSSLFSRLGNSLGNILFSSYNADIESKSGYKEEAKGYNDGSLIEESSSKNQHVDQEKCSEDEIGVNNNNNSTDKPKNNNIQTQNLKINNSFQENLECVKELSTIENVSPNPLISNEYDIDKINKSEDDLLLTNIEIKSPPIKNKTLTAFEISQENIKHNNFMHKTFETKVSDVCEKNIVDPSIDNVMASMDNSYDEIKEMSVPKKGYNLDMFDDQNYNPFQTKNTISNSPTPICDKQSLDDNKSIVNSNQVSEELENKECSAIKSVSLKKKNVMKKKVLTGTGNIKKDSDEIIKDTYAKVSDVSKKDMVNPSSNKFVVSISSSGDDIEEIAAPKKGYNLDVFDDPNYNPFQTKNTVSNSPTQISNKQSLDENKSINSSNQINKELEHKKSLAIKSVSLKKKMLMKKEVFAETDVVENASKEIIENSLAKVSDVSKKDKVNSSNDSLLVSMGNSDDEVQEISFQKKGYNLDMFDDPNYNPFQTKNTVSNSPTPICDKQSYCEDFHKLTNSEASPELSNKNLRHNLDTQPANFEKGIIEESVHFALQNTKKPLPKKSNNGNLKGKLF